MSLPCILGKHSIREREALPADPSNPENWSGEDKLTVVIETATLDEKELSEYCRKKKGLYAKQVARWKEISISGHDTSDLLSKAKRRELQQLKKMSHKTEKELRRNEKALAEAAALLVLKKKPWPSGGTEGKDDHSRRPSDGN